MLIIAQAVARIATWISGAAFVVCSLLVAVEVVLRKTLGYSLGGVDEISSYVFAIGVAWSFAYTVLGRAHIRIDALYVVFKPRVRVILDLLSLLALLAVGGLLLQQATSTALTSLEIGARSNTPLGITLWIPQALWAAGLAFFVLVLVLLTVRTAAFAAKSEYRRAAEIAGIRTIEEEVRDEV